MTRKITFCIIAIAWLVNVTGVRGQQHPAVPAGTVGYTVSVGRYWPAIYKGTTFARVSIETFPAIPVTVDEEFAVTVRSFQGGGAEAIVKSSLTVKAGQSSGYVDVYIPVSIPVTIPVSINNYGDADLLVESGKGDGEFTEGKDLLNAGFRTGEDLGFIHVRQASVLFISANLISWPGRKWRCYPGMSYGGPTFGGLAKSKTEPLPAIANFEIALGLLDGKNVNLRTAKISVLQTSEAIRGCRPEDLPDDWIGLSGIQQIFVSFADFKSICLGQDSKRDCLERWVAVGGSLVVYDLGPDYRELDKLFSFLVGRERVGASGRFQRQWRMPGQDVIGLSRMILVRERFGYGYDDKNWTLRESVGVQTGNDWKRFDAAQDVDDGSLLPPWVIGNHLNGRIVAVNDNMQNWSPADWRGLHNGLALDSNGIGREIGDANVGNFKPGFTIPGVGEPPLSAFGWLISLFLLIAGPVMFLVLRRTRQMQLLFVLVPILSLVSCLGLIGYAVVIDGFDLWGRVQSVTRIDHRTQSAVGHARSSYYTGSRPGPYVYSSDTLVMRSSQGDAQTELIEQGATSIEYFGGDIRTRTQHQIVTVRSFQTDRRLIWDSGNGGVGTTDGEQSPAAHVRNRLGAKVLYAVARTEDGMFAVENLDDGQQAVAVSVESNIAEMELKAWANELSPQSINWYGASYSVYGVADGSSWGNEERVVEQLRAGGGLKFLGETNTYLAIVECSPLIADQIEPVRYKKQLHVIIGKW